MADYHTALSQAAGFILQNDQFLLVNHVNPDGDATSSLLAMGLILEKLGKQVVMANEGSTPQKFSFLPGAENILNASTNPRKNRFQNIITCDCADFSRVGSLKEWFADDYQLLNIDHHPTNDGFGSLNLVQNRAAATAEIVYDLMKKLQFECFPALAKCIYTGLMTDTGGFRYSNTTSHVMEIASDLLAYEVKPNEIADRVLESITRAHLELLKKALTTLEISEEGRMASLSVKVEDMIETGALPEDLDGIVHYARNIEGVEVGILYKEQKDGKVKVSLRSRDYVNVADIALSFGGGGHIRAAGCTFYGTLEEAREAFKAKLHESFLFQGEEK